MARAGGRDRRVDSRRGKPSSRREKRREFDPGEDAAATVGTDGRIEHGDDAAARRRLARVQPEEELPARRARALREGHPPGGALDRGLSRGGRRRSERELDEEAGRGRAGAAVGRGWKKRGRTLSHFMYGVGSGGTELFAPPPVPPFTRMASVKVRKNDSGDQLR